MKKTSVLVHEPAAPSTNPRILSWIRAGVQGCARPEKRDLKIEAAEHRQEQVKAMIDGEITDSAGMNQSLPSAKGRRAGGEAVSAIAFPQRTLHR